ncbi:MAG: CDF family Co(II)/Ni(II) efflux transporter DmeF [Alphaproteobacteria bacterium]
MSVDHCSQSGFFQSPASRENERRTLIVVALTAVMMVAEIICGWWFGSMALLADGFHMATHAGALGISAFAYGYARKHAHDPQYSFGTGKVSDLAGFTSAIILGITSLCIVIESGSRLIMPQPIAYGDAIIVALIGLIVNLVSARILHVKHDHHDHGDDHHGHHHDYNLRSAYLHVIADALTSIMALIALACGWLLGWSWMDPLIGIVGAAVIMVWAFGLLRDTVAVLLDKTPRSDIANKVRAILSAQQAEIHDLHIWRIAPGAHAAIVAVTAKEPLTADQIRIWLKPLGFAHITVEVAQKAN